MGCAPNVPKHSYETERDLIRNIFSSRWTLKCDFFLNLIKCGFFCFVLCGSYKSFTLNMSNVRKDEKMQSERESLWHRGQHTSTLSKIKRPKVQS